MKTLILILAAAVLIPLAVFSQNSPPAAPVKSNPEGAVADYKLVQEYDPSQLQRKVNEAIKLGWQPLGTVVLAPPDSQTGTRIAYLQAMTFTPRR